MRYIDVLKKYAKKNLFADDFLMQEIDKYLVGLFGSVESNINPEKEANPDKIVEEGIKYLISKGMDEKDAEDELVRVMGKLTPNPETIRSLFWKNYEKSPLEATDWYYHLQVMNDYVKLSHINKNKIWKSVDKNPEIDLAINLSKPEKTAAQIKADKERVLPKNAPANYPKCMLCIENEGCHGGYGTPARDNLRLIKLCLNNEDWYVQYSPYGYFDEHCIVIHKDHVPMYTNRGSITALLDFLDYFPHYFVGSNCGMPIIGGSILSHQHFQGGRYKLPIFDAKVRKTYTSSLHHDVKVSLLEWPNKVFVVTGKDKEKVLDVVEQVRKTWENFDYPEVNIVSHSNGEPHSGASLLTEKVNDEYKVMLVLRNNLTSNQYPDGIFHTSVERQMIKKEGIGLIECGGRFILPPRLIRQGNWMDEIKADYSSKDNVLENPELEAFKPIVDDFVNSKYKTFSEYMEMCCQKMLSDVDPFKFDKDGKAFNAFIEKLSLK